MIKPEVLKWSVLSAIAAAGAVMMAAALAPGAAHAATVQTQPTQYAVTDASATVATGGTFQTVFAANAGRHDCVIENPTTATEALYVHADAGSATTANSFSLAAGGVFNCAAYGIVTPDIVQVTAVTTAHAFVAKSQ